MLKPATLHREVKEKDLFSAMKEVNIKLYRSCFLYGVECSILVLWFILQLEMWNGKKRRQKTFHRIAFFSHDIPSNGSNRGLPNLLELSRVYVVGRGED